MEKTRFQQELTDILSSLKTAVALAEELDLEPPPLPGRGGHEMKAQEGIQKSLGKIQDLEELRAFLDGCTRCALHKGRKNIVFGEGNPEARLVFVGEGPGREEDETGRPFVGDAGKLLTKIITNGMGLRREDVFICNVVKCRPPGNRDPKEEEIKECLPFLRRQLEIIKPEVICVLGRVAGAALLGKDFSITRDRGKWFSYMGIPLIATFHPAYVLRNPQAKRPVWEDIKKVMSRLGLEVGTRNG